MRYVVQVIAIGGTARIGLERAYEEDLLEDADVTPSFVQGYVEGDRMHRLAELGLKFSVVAPPPVEEAPWPGGGVVFRRASAQPFGAAPASVRAAYFELELVGVLTPSVRSRLEEGGVRILERIADRMWTVRIDGSPNSVRDDQAVERLRPVRGASSGRSPGAAVRSFGAAPRANAGAGGAGASYEALLQPDADVGAVATALGAAGAVVVSASGRVVRLTAGPESLVALGAVEGVASLAAAGVPRPLNDVARPLIGIAGGVGTRPGGLDGAGEIIGIADTGLDLDHPDFAGRVVGTSCLGRPGDCSDPDGHGTHVAGTAAGDGTASGGLLAGVAPAAGIFLQSLLDGHGGLGGLPADVGDLFAEAYAADVRVHNNSWGIFLHARYPGASLQVDAFVDGHPDFLAVVAAGNDGSCLPGRNAGAPGFVDLPSMAAPGTSKNALVVGASRSSRTALGYSGLTYGEAWPESFPRRPIAAERVSGDPDGLAAFSARGPTDDMRVKPDVVAPGTDIASARSAAASPSRFWGSWPGDARYAVMGGTSMACPLVAGLAVLVRQWYRRDAGHANPSAALLKATIVNGATPLPGVDAVAHPSGDPNFHQGFGRVDLLRSVPTPGCSFDLAFVDTLSEPGLELRATGDLATFRIEVREDCDLRFCLAWTDVAGRGLQNTLYLTLETPDGALSTSNASLPAGLVLPTPLPGGLPDQTVDRDANNNLHTLRIAGAPAGVYVVTVASWDLIRRQGYALVATGAVGPLMPVAS